jgi:hypothetical protein
MLAALAADRSAFFGLKTMTISRGHDLMAAFFPQEQKATA